MPMLANDLGVSVSTIKRDILSLTVDEEYPIDTEQGNGGGVVLRNFNKHPQHILSGEQISALTKAATVTDPKTAGILQGIIRAYS